MSLEPSLIAGEPVGFASQDQISPALGVRSTSFTGNEFAHCPRIWVRSRRLKAVATRTTPGAIVGTAGRPRSEICLPSSEPRQFGVPPRARVGCPACSGISRNTLKFIDFDQARFSVGAGAAERPRNNLRPRGSSVDWATICQRDEIGWNATRALNGAQTTLRRRGSRVVISFGFSQYKKFAERPTPGQFTRPPHREAHCRQFNR